MFFEILNALVQVAPSAARVYEAKQGAEVDMYRQDTQSRCFETYCGVLDRDSARDHHVSMKKLELAETFAEEGYREQAVDIVRSCVDSSERDMRRLNEARMALAGLLREEVGNAPKELPRHRR